jgi:hypothetical protein
MMRLSHIQLELVVSVVFLWDLVVITHSNKKQLKLDESYT